MLPLCLCQPFELLTALPLVEQVPQRHEPDLLLRPMEERDAVKDKSGKQLIVPQGTFSCAFGTIHLVAYPTTTFFESSSLSTFRFAPLNMASMMESL